MSKELMPRTVHVGEWHESQGIAKRFEVSIGWNEEGDACGWRTGIARYFKREDAEAHANVLRAALAWEPPSKGVTSITYRPNGESFTVTTVIEKEKKTT